MDEYYVKWPAAFFLLTAERWYERASEDEVEFTMIVMIGLS